jgi:EpsI family protein
MSLSRREIVAGLTMLIAAGAAAARVPNIKIDYLGKYTLDDIVPKRIGPWEMVGSSGVVVPPKDQLQLTLYSEVLTRVYYDGANAPIMLLIAYSANQTGFLQVHRPEFCYTAAGYKLSDFFPHNIPLDASMAVPATVLNATRDGVVEKVMYWTRIGDQIPTSWARQKLAVAEDNLRRLIPDAALVRVSTLVASDEGALAAMDNFVRALIASVPRQLTRVLVA